MARRKSKRGVVTTKTKPKWERDLNAWKRQTVGQLKTLFALAGVIWVLWLLAQYLMG